MHSVKTSAPKAIPYRRHVTLKAWVHSSVDDYPGFGARKYGTVLRQGFQEFGQFRTSMLVFWRLCSISAYFWPISADWFDQAALPECHSVRNAICTTGSLSHFISEGRNLVHIHAILHKTTGKCQRVQHVAPSDLTLNFAVDCIFGMMITI